MATLTLSLPSMYGDHHVLEVRRILFELPGVEDVYASSSFHTVEVTYDPAKVDADTITAALDHAGYLEEWLMPLETNQPAALLEKGVAYFRHTAAYQQTGQTVGFAQNVGYAGRALWPCPGMGPVRVMDEGE